MRCIDRCDVRSILLDGEVNDGVSMVGLFYSLRHTRTQLVRVIDYVLDSGGSGSSGGQSFKR
jgi:hypothetical protein